MYARTIQHSAAFLPAVLFIAVAVALYLWPEPVVYLRGYLDGADAAGYVAFVLLLVLATVFVPVTVLPLIPVAAALFGPFATGVLSTIGWTLGAAAAFMVARTFGRPAVSTFVPLDRLNALVARIPARAQFFTIVLLRISLPVDLLSYAFGLSRSIGWKTHLAATAVGVTWFSFAFAYLGSAFVSENSTLLLATGMSALVLFAASWAILIRQSRSAPGHDPERAPESEE